MSGDPDTGVGRHDAQIESSGPVPFSATVLAFFACAFSVAILAHGADGSVSDVAWARW